MVDLDTEADFEELTESSSSGVEMKKCMQVLFALVLLGASAPKASTQAPSKKVKAFPLWNFDEREGMCRAKGRLQDLEYCSSKTMDQIIVMGKDAIPILISQITDTRPTKEPIYDYWPTMKVGDVATFILEDLFLDSDWKRSTCQACRP